MAKTLAEFVQGLPDPQELWDESELLTSERPDYNKRSNFLMPEASNFAFYKTEDGSGSEGVLLVRKAEDGLIDAALLYAYDHESSLTANIEDDEGADHQPALQGLPDDFNPALGAGSPLFWNFEGYPATSNHIFATAAAWYVNGKWHYAEGLDNANDFDGNPIDDTKMVRQFYSTFRSMGF
jgi:hypothetical protein